MFILQNILAFTGIWGRYSWHTVVVMASKHSFSRQEFHKSLDNSPWLFYTLFQFFTEWLMYILFEFIFFFSCLTLQNAATALWSQERSVTVVVQLWVVEVYLKIWWLKTQWIWTLHQTSWFLRLYWQRKKHLDDESLVKNEENCQLCFLWFLGVCKRRAKLL